MASDISSLSHGDCSSVFGSTRTHQSKTSQNPSESDSSEKTFHEHNPLYDANHWNSGKDAIGENEGLDIPLKESLEGDERSCDESTIKELEGIESYGEEGFVTPIRSHGAPLDTITERTSVATIQKSLLSPSLSSFAEIQNSNRRVSAPGATVLPLETFKDCRLTKSLEETLLQTQRPMVKLQLILETSESMLCDDLNIINPTKSCEPAPQRTTAPLGMSQKPEDLPTSIPKPNNAVNRRTSAYVRGIYRKLVGAEQREQISPNTARASRIPVLAHLARGGRTEQAYCKGSESAHGKEKIHDIGNHTFRDSEEIELEHPKRDRQPSQDRFPTILPNGFPIVLPPNSLEDENFHHSRAISKRLSRISAGTSRLFESPRTPSSEERSTRSKVSAKPNTPTPCQPRMGKIPLDLEDPQISGSRVILVREHSDTTPQKDLPLDSQPKAVRNRSIFDIRAEEPREDVGHPNGRITSPAPTISFLEVRNGVSPSAASKTSDNGTPNSWVLPLGPFPQPPSPNYFVTARSSRHFLDDVALHHHTSAGVVADKAPAMSSSSIHPATASPAVRSIAASNSSTSLVTGHAMRPKALPNDGDPFLSRINAQDFDGIAATETTPERTDIPTTPIHMPSPLRPRNRPSLKYSLFPAETEAALTPKPGFKEPLIRNLRSLSSMLRVPNATMRASSSSDLGNKVTQRTCPHGKHIERVGVFSGRKVGGRAWRLRHFVRDGGQRCWKCRLDRLRPKLRGIGNQLLSHVKKTGTANNLRTDVAATSSGFERPSPPPNAKVQSAPLSVRYPLGEVEQQRAARSKQLDGSASINKVMALGDRWALWTPKCFCQADDDASVTPAREKDVDVHRVRSAHIRHVIE